MIGYTWSEIFGMVPKYLGGFRHDPRQDPVCASGVLRELLWAAASYIEVAPGIGVRVSSSTNCRTRQKSCVSGIMWFEFSPTFAIFVSSVANVRSCDGSALRCGRRIHMEARRLGPRGCPNAGRHHAAKPRIAATVEQRIKRRVSQESLRSRYPTPGSVRM